MHNGDLLDNQVNKREVKSAVYDPDISANPFEHSWRDTI